MNEFKVYRLNAAGLEKADAVAQVFENVLERLRALFIRTDEPGLIVSSNSAREQALVVTKLQEACHFAKRVIALDEKMQEKP